MQEFAQAVVDGDRRALARAITLVESTKPEHNRQAEDLIGELLPHTGRSTRIGITGPPGVGKSTFIDALGLLVVKAGSRLAVLAVDPSSATAGGSILGDKTRMGSLANSTDVFVRPSPSGGTLGGIGRRTRDAVLLCEASGYDVVLIETVGVGQSETAVATVADLFVLLVPPGGGDDLQGIKRGIMELADLVVVNKADGSTVDLAEETAGHYRSALHLLPPKHQGLETPVLCCSSIEASGLDEVWQRIETLHQHLKSTGQLASLRHHQATTQLDAEVRASLYARASTRPGFADQRAAVEAAVAAGQLSVSAGARQLADLAFDEPPA